MDTRIRRGPFLLNSLLLLSLAPVLLLEAAQAAGPQASLPPELCVDRIHKDISAGNIDRRKAAARRRVEHDLRQFQDRSGVLTLTNRPHKYERRRGYVEVKLDFKPIVVAPRFRKRLSATDYSTDEVDGLVRHYARLYGLDETLVHAVIEVESDYKAHAVSRCGARGLMQLMPGTAAEMGVTNAFDPAQNIAGGTQYLAKMLEIFDNDLALALAAYNAGPNAVKKYNGIPPYEETREYVAAICAHAGKPVSARSYAVSSNRPSAAFLPGTPKKGYIVHFRSGYTQAADAVIDEDPYYYVQYGNRTGRVRKDLVTKIVQPA